MRTVPLDIRGMYISAYLPILIEKEIRLASASSELETGLIHIEGNSLLCGGITLMTHFMEQKLRQIVKKFLIFCRLSTKL